VGLNVLVIDRAPPTSDLQGNELIARHVVPLLRAAGHRVTLLAPVVADGAVEARAAIADLFDAVRLVPRSHRLTSLLGWFEPIAAKLRIGFGNRLDAAAARRFRGELVQILATERIDVVHVRQLPMAAYAGALGRTPRLLELVDAETLAATRRRSGRLRSSIRHIVARAVERQALASFPVVTVVAEPDAAALRALRDGSRVEVIPNGVDVNAFRPRPDLDVVPDSIVFVGAMSFPPNMEAVAWFVAEVLPLLHAARPSVHFSIVGRDPSPAVRELAANPAVTVTGQVDDVRPHLARAAVVVAPMVSGSGIKNKILEAMAMQRPVVATPLAAEGLAAVRDRDFLIAGSPAEFAGAVAALLADPDRASSVAAAGRALVTERYTWEACAARYAALYAELAVARIGVPAADAPSGVPGP
jgi:polysaccharide biosynthesis protein PslH